MTEEQQGNLKKGTNSYFGRPQRDPEYMFTYKYKHINSGLLKLDHNNTCTLLLHCKDEMNTHIKNKQTTKQLDTNFQVGDWNALTPRREVL